MTNTNHTPIVELQNLHFSYGEHETLSHIDLVVQRGDYLGIIGPNGAGKTTLLKLILGLLRPTSGTVFLFGKEQSTFTERERLGYVPQKTSLFDANFPATVLEVVLMGRYAKRRLFHMATKEDRDNAKLALERVGMWEHRNRLIGNLSGGQQQRVFIARALATGPEVILLDEPTVGIDHRSQEDFYSLLRELHQKEGLTIILISHDVGVIAQEVSRLAYIDNTLSYYSSPSLFLNTGAAHALSHGHDH